MACGATMKTEKASRRDTCPADLKDGRHPNITPSGVKAWAGKTGVVERDSPQEGVRRQHGRL